MCRRREEREGDTGCASVRGVPVARHSVAVPEVSAGAYTWNYVGARDAEREEIVLTAAVRSCATQSVRKTWSRCAGALALLGATLAGSAGCGLEFDTGGSLDRLPAGSAERLRILASAEPAGTDVILPVTIERLAREDDILGRDTTRIRCVIVRVIGAARLVDLGTSVDGVLTTRDQVAIDLDRGESRQVGVAASRAGAALVWARLLDSSCPASSSDTAALAEGSRTVRFEAGDLLPLDINVAGAGDGGAGDPEDAGMDESL